jgi:hypothetical protein
VHFHGNSVGDVGAAALAQALKANSGHAPTPVSMLGNAGNDL